MCKHYSIKEIALMSGLTERTIRKYIQAGILEGEKAEGVWRFSPEEVDSFLEHPNVLPSIQTKRNGIVLDFLPNRNKITNQMCAILDFPEEHGKMVLDFFKTHYNSGSYGSDLQFYYDDFEKCPRIIIKGRTDDVIRILDQFYCLTRNHFEGRREI